MTTDLAVRTGSDLAINGDQNGWTDKQVAALHQLGVKDASQGDLDVFFHQCQRTGLDPFAKQIYMIGRTAKEKDDRGQWRETTKYTIQTGIDGYRLIARRAADRSHETLGYGDTVWCGPDGRWVDVWLSDDHPAAAKVTVLRNGQQFPGLALWNEYVQTKKDFKSGEIMPNSMWERMGAGQLAKCAEALALRKAFPQDLSGIYTTDEMGQADNHTARQIPPKPTSLSQATQEHQAFAHAPAEPHLRTAQQATKLAVLMRTLGMDNRDEALAYISGVIGRDLDSTKNLTVYEASQIIDHLEQAEKDNVNPVTGVVMAELEPDGGWPPVAGADQ